MEIINTGYISRAEPGTTRACITFAAVTALADGTLLATARAGQDKDCDGELIEFYRSNDNGQSWSKPEIPFRDVMVNGHLGTLKLCYLTEISPGHVLAAAMWIDREAHPGKPLFNSDTEGCLPMAILLADSHDRGQSWSPWRQVPMPDNIGPPSLTNPILKLANCTLAMSIETNKHYRDTSKWKQKAVFFHSTDLGQSWTGPVSVAEDRTARIFNWDLRCGVGVDDRIATFAWTYDTEAEKYVNIHRRISGDGGYSWDAQVDLGFADQAGPPAMLADGRVLLVWVDRFGDQCIRARVAPAIDAPFDADSEVVVYKHQTPPDAGSRDMGDLLAGMEMWSFGLPYATALNDGDVLISFYAGNSQAMDIHFARLRL